MRREMACKATAILMTGVAVAAVALLVLVIGLGSEIAPATTVAPAAHIPRIGTEPIPTPSEAAAKAPTQVEMHNVDFHVDETTILKIHRLRGTMQAKKAGDPLNFDNKLTFVMKVDTGDIGMKNGALDPLMNLYFFAY